MCVNALSGLYLISTRKGERGNYERIICVNALSGLYLISTPIGRARLLFNLLVSMPSRAYTSFLPEIHKLPATLLGRVSMPSRAYTSFLQCGSNVFPYGSASCQCPLGLIPHFYEWRSGCP